jgi:hypothetical protein
LERFCLLLCGVFDALAHAFLSLNFVVDLEEKFTANSEELSFVTALAFFFSVSEAFFDGFKALFGTAFVAKAIGKQREEG